MISIEFKEDNKFCHLRVNGHANYREMPGEFDIVCALVSTLAQTAMYGCAKYGKDVKCTMHDGLIDIYFPKNQDKAKAIAESCFYGIEEIKREYPQCFK